jgi:hypothetical protein
MEERPGKQSGCYAMTGMLTLGRSANAGILTAYQDFLGSAVGISIRHCKIDVGVCIVPRRETLRH